MLERYEAKSTTYKCLEILVRIEYKATHLNVYANDSPVHIQT